MDVIGGNNRLRGAKLIIITKDHNDGGSSGTVRWKRDCVDIQRIWCVTTDKSCADEVLDFMFQQPTIF